VALLTALSACLLPVGPDLEPLPQPGPVTSTFLPAEDAAARIRLREASRDGATVSLDIESDLDVAVYGVAYALRFDAACLKLQRWDGDGLEAPVRAGRSTTAGQVIGVATFRGRATGAVPGKRTWGRLTFEALRQGDCELRFDAAGSQARSPDGTALAVAWAGGTVRASPAP
jgi:hypothetical protein